MSMLTNLTDASRRRLSSLETLCELERKGFVFVPYYAHMELDSPLLRNVSMPDSGWKVSLNGSPVAYIRCYNSNGNVEGIYADGQPIPGRTAEQFAGTLLRKYSQPDERPHALDNLIEHLLGATA